MTVECNNVSGPSNLLGCRELDNGSIKWNFTPDDYTTNGLTPGEYTYTFDVSTGDNDPGLTKQFSFKIILIDGCLTPVIVQPTTVAQEYTITDFAKDYQLTDKFSVSPTYCADSISYTAPGLESYLQWNESTQKFTFPQVTDSLSLSGDRE